MAKKYRILNSFVYKGPDGNWKQPKWVTIGPGENVPELESGVLNRLIDAHSICEVDMYGDNIQHEKLQELNGEEISRLFEGKHPPLIINLIKSNKYSHDTLSRMLAYCEKMKIPHVPAFLEQLLTG